MEFYRNLGQFSPAFRKKAFSRVWLRFRITAYS